ncbi:hypothetical protein RGC41_07820, partial [Helicobacter pylori]|nr:hypothetical protein [Helicobacter pylori]
ICTYISALKDGVFRASGINLNKGGKPTPKETLLDYFCTGMDYVIQIKKKGSDRIIDDVLNVKSEFKKELML